MNVIGKYEPLVKSSKFLPNPVAINGVPPYADTIANPKVKGTAAWKEWWMEQFRRCIHGYHTGGMFIPGRYYYYLNHCYLYTVGKGQHHPYISDIDLEFFNAIELAKKEHMGIIGLKARRKGFSFKVSGGVIDYGFRFFEKYEAGICAGLEEHSLDFLRKFNQSNSFKRPELQLHLNPDNDNLKISCWEEKTPTGWQKKGAMNALYCETMFNNPGKFKGKKLEDCVFEESGEFDLLLEAYEATKPCFMDGDFMVGTPYIYGTGGNIKSSSKGFKEMWHEHESFKLLRVEVMADRMYFPCVAGYTDKDGKLAEDIPYLKEKYPDPQQRIGMEDTQRARERILEERAIKEKNPDKAAYFHHLQNYPLDTKESWMTFISNKFNTVKLNTQLYNIDELARNNWKRYDLEYVTDESGGLVYPLKVKAVPLPENSKSDCYLMIHKHPVDGYIDLDLAGIDSYDLDESDTSKSLGSMIVLRTENTIPDNVSMTPVAMIYCRPKRKEDFYELCLKTAIYYDLKRNVLVDVDRPLVIQHFKDSPGGKKYLARRPRSIESESSKQKHEFGVKLTAQSKPKMIAMLQSYVEDFYENIWFRELLLDLLSYDVEARESDWDSADAMGIALIRLMDRKKQARTKDQNEELQNRFETPAYKEVNGQIFLEKGQADEDLADIKDPFLRQLYSGKLG